MKTYPIEYTQPQDFYRNYCLWDYQPIANVTDKFRPINLLFHSFEVAQLNSQVLEIVESIKKAIGIFQTVWGIKWIDQKLAWEFYFYDYARWERKVSMTKVLQAIKPYVNCNITPLEEMPYFMFSLDINHQVISNSQLDKINMYIGNPGSSVSSGIAYAVGVNKTELENFYFFFDAHKQLDDAASKIACSAYLNSREFDIEKILLPELRKCHTICIANKRNSDTVYFSGVNIQQIIFFLERFDYPEEIINYVKNNQSKLDHLLYDVGFDYRVDMQKLKVIKSGYYGVF